MVPIAVGMPPRSAATGFDHSANAFDPVNRQSHFARHGLSIETGTNPACIRAERQTSNVTKYISFYRSPLASARFTDRTLDDLYARQARGDATERRQLAGLPLLWMRRYVVLNERLKNWTMSPSHFLYQDRPDVWLTPE
jgi:hypothetical protein